MKRRILLDALRGTSLDSGELASLDDRLPGNGQVRLEQVVDWLVETRIRGSESEAWHFVARAFGMEFLDLSTCSPDSELLEQFDPSLIREFRVLPVDEPSGTLRLAVPEPPVGQIRDDVRMLLDREFRFGLARPDVWQQRRQEWVSDSETDLDDLTKTLEDERAAANRETSDQGGQGTRRSCSDQPIITFVNLLLREAVEADASDVHIEPRASDLLVRYRVDGMLRPIHRLPLDLHGPIVNRIKLLAGMNLDERRIPQDGRISGPPSLPVVDLRVSSVPGRGGESLVLRILDDRKVRFSLDDLGFQPGQRNHLERLLQSNRGLILGTGPTGSGKTTTMYAVLRALRSVERKVITLEDPVEYRLEGINQVQVNPTLDRGFAEGLRALLRQNPDVIFVGEIRDSSTAQTALRSSLTGHLVFSTLHTNDAPRAVHRLLDLGVEPHLIGASLRAVLAQRLARVPCRHCREPRQFDSREIVQAMGSEPPEGTYYRAVGCDRCDETGYSGRTLLAQLLPVTASIRDSILRGEPVKTFRDRAYEAGMMGLREAGIRLASRGRTTLQEVVRVTPDPRARGSTETTPPKPPDS